MVPILNVILFITGFIILLFVVKFLFRVIAITFNWLPVLLLILLSSLILVGILIVSLTLTSLILFGAFIVLVIASLSFAFRRSRDKILVRKYLRRHHHFRRR